MSEYIDKSLHWKKEPVVGSLNWVAYNDKRYTVVNVFLGFDKTTVRVNEAFTSYCSTLENYLKKLDTTKNSILFLEIKEPTKKD